MGSFKEYFQVQVARIEEEAKASYQQTISSARHLAVAAEEHFAPFDGFVRGLFKVLLRPEEGLVEVLPPSYRRELFKAPFNWNGDTVEVVEDGIGVNESCGCRLVYRPKGSGT